MPHRRPTSRTYTTTSRATAPTGRAAENIKPTDAYLDIAAKLAKMQVQLAAINEKLTDLPDHEARLRELETANNKRLGARLLLGTLATSAPGWLALVITRH